MMRAIFTLLLLLGAGATLAQGYPSRPIRLIVPNAPGGPTDVVARLIAQKISETIGQPMVVDNRSGAGGIVGTEAVAKSSPDGYTLMFSASGPMVITPHLNPNLPFDAQRDFLPVALGATSNMFLIVPPTSPARSVMDIIALARSQPGKLNYGTAGIGTPPHMAAELFRIMAGVDVVHVPYKGVPQAEAATMSGDVAFMFNAPSTLNLARAGKVRVLAVSGSQRSKLAPDLPTLAESGVPDFNVTAWYGLFAPARTPGEIATRLNSEIRDALRQTELSSRLLSIGYELPAAYTAEEFHAFVRGESAKWKKVVTDAHIKAE
jgi:tripartite-type tricarboxylate transporter receptor subunit TctC